MEKNVITGTYEKDGERIEFNCYTTLSAYDKIQFVKNVCETLVSDDYQSIIRDLIFDYQLIKSFTDIDVSEVRESDNIVNSIEEFVESMTDVIEFIELNTAFGLVDELNKAVDNNIEYRTGVHKNVIADSLSELIKTIETKIVEINLEDVFNEIKELNEKSDKITDVYKNIFAFKKDTSDNK